MWVPLVAVPARVSGVLLSPQLTTIFETVPSGSAAVNDNETVWPVLAGFGETEEIVTTGGRSFTVSVVVAEPGPALLVAVTVIVKVLLIALPVLA